MSVWNNEAIVDLVVELWDQGRTGTEIAQTIEVRFNVLLTRNAVIAKLDRMGKIGKRGGLGAAGTSRAQNEARRRKAVKTMAQKAVAPVQAKPKVEAPPQGWFAMQNKPREVEPYVERQARVFDPAKLVTFDQLDEAHHCKWPIGDPKNPEFRFCGEAKVIGLPYCKDCLSIAFQPREVAPSHGVTARPVSSAAGGHIVVTHHVGTQETETAAGEAAERETEDA